MKAQTLLRQAEKLFNERADIQPGKRGQYAVEKRTVKAGESLPVVSARTAMFTGMPLCSLKLQQDVQITWLTATGQGDWMSDQPCELIQMHRDLAQYAKGDVLVGGLGLGIVSRMAVRRPKVKSVTTVEISGEVCQLTGSGLTIENTDIHRFVKYLKPGEFTTALLDSWQGTGEATWLEEVVPLRRAIGTKIQRVICWQEQVMQNQVYRPLFRAADIPAEMFLSKYNCHYYAWRKMLEKQFKRTQSRIDPRAQDFPRMFEVSQENEQDNLLKLMAHVFLCDVGKPNWERLFGKYWDEGWNSSREEKTA